MQFYAWLNCAQVTFSLESLTVVASLVEWVPLDKIATTSDENCHKARDRPAGSHFRRDHSKMLLRPTEFGRKHPQSFTVQAHVNERFALEFLE